MSMHVTAHVRFRDGTTVTGRYAPSVGLLADRLDGAVRDCWDDGEPVTVEADGMRWQAVVCRTHLVVRTGHDPWGDDDWDGPRV